MMFRHGSYRKWNAWEAPLSEVEAKRGGLSRVQLLDRAEEMLADLDIAGCNLAAAHMSRVVDALKSE